MKSSILSLAFVFVACGKVDQLTQKEDGSSLTAPTAIAAVTATPAVGSYTGSVSPASSSGTTTSETLYSFSVTDINNLPICNASHETQLAYVRVEKKFYTCENGKWNETEINSTSSTSVAVAATVVATPTPTIIAEKGDKGDKGNSGVSVSSFTDIILSTGLHHTCAVYSGDLYCWGRGDFGSLGNGVNSSSSSPVKVIGLTDAVTQVAAGASSTCALLANKQVMCWGQNNAGQLGNSTNINSNVPHLIPDLSNVVNIAAGRFHFCANLYDGQVKCWGQNNAGQLGNGTTTNSNKPVSVNIDAIEVQAGEYNTCALTLNAGFYCWGSNFSSNIPVNQATALSNKTPLDFKMGWGRVCVRTAESGYNCLGATTGVLAAAGVDVTTSTLLGLSMNYTCVVPPTANAKASCNGNPIINAISQGEYTINDLVAGYNHICYTVSNRVYCFGDNSWGQLGNGNNISNSASQMVKF